MEFDNNKINTLCKKAELSETSDSADKFCEILTYYAKDTYEILNVKTENVLKKRNAVDYSLLRNDVPVTFSATDILFDSERKTENNCLCIAKII